MTEALNLQGEQFGRPALRKALQQTRSLDISESVARLHELLRQHCLRRTQTDDITLLALEIIDEPKNGENSSSLPI